MLFVLISSCKLERATENSIKSVNQQIPVSQNHAYNIVKGTIATKLDNNIRSVFQDKNGNYWFGTNGVGVFRYDKKTLTQYTVKDGLANNQIQSIQEDESGNIWFGTGAFGVSKFDGRIFTAITNKDKLQDSYGAEKVTKTEPKDLWFYAGGGAFYANDKSFAYLALDKNSNNSGQSQSSAFDLSRFAVYSILKDKKGNVWFGTQAQGVCRYDGKFFKWFTDKGLSGSAVLALCEDSKGNLWFGNNGAGLFKYDGISLINITEEKGLGNKEFKVNGKSGPGTLARIYSICEEKPGELWIGTVDAGVWKYDGSRLRNYTIKDGLTSNAINVIYKDKIGDLWFGTDSDGLFKFNGKSFTNFNVNLD